MDCNLLGKVRTEAMKRASSIARQTARPAVIQPAEKIQVLLALALREYHAERMAEVEKMCLQILAIDTRHASRWLSG
jgi:hypothetical protein